jgi:hypothetical protein
MCLKANSYPRDPTWLQPTYHSDEESNDGEDLFPKGERSSDWLHPAHHLSTQRIRETTITTMKEYRGKWEDVTANDMPRNFLPVRRISLLETFAYLSFSRF